MTNFATFAEGSLSVILSHLGDRVLRDDEIAVAVLPLVVVDRVAARAVDDDSDHRCAGHVRHVRKCKPFRRELEVRWVVRVSGDGGTIAQLNLHLWRQQRSPRLLTRSPKDPFRILAEIPK